MGNLPQFDISSIDAGDVGLTIPWLAGVLISAVLILVATGPMKKHFLRRAFLVVLATVGWTVAFAVGAAGLAIALGFAAALSPKRHAAGKRHQQRAFVGVSVVAASVQFAAVGWYTNDPQIMFAVPGAVIAVAAGALVIQRLTRPKLDQIRAFTDTDKALSLARQHGECNYRDEGCPCSVSRGDLFEGDHIVPWAHGGPSIAKNAQMLCHTCNMLKSALPDDEARDKVRAHWATHGGLRPAWRIGRRRRRRAAQQTPVAVSVEQAA